MDKLIKEIIAFRDERNWKPYHTPSNLAKSIMIEAAELLENYQWDDKALDLKNVKEEIADILIYTLMLTHHYDFDIESLILDKLAKNNKKYPAPNKKGL
ncbi:MAG: nucleotide pyrophosphohydrolase [Candidatus Izemoplasmataceae bacterium]